MAFLEHKYCRACAAEVQHINGTCSICRQRLAREALAAWQSKTVEEKLLDLHQRLLRQEAGPARF